MSIAPGQTRTLVLPADFALDTDGSVLPRTAAGSEPVRAVDGTVVAFEADDVDEARQAGWSVVVTGPAPVVTDPAGRARLSRTGPVSWAPAWREVFVRVEPVPVTGRELVGGRTLYRVDLGVDLAADR